jgi:hypothetical protein
MKRKRTYPTEEDDPRTSSKIRRQMAIISHIPPPTPTSNKYINRSPTTTVYRAFPDHFKKKNTAIQSTKSETIRTPQQLKKIKNTDILSSMLCMITVH